MYRCTPQEHRIIVSIFLRNNSSVLLAHREFRCKFFVRLTPTGQTIQCLVSRLDEYGTTRDVVQCRRPQSSRFAETMMTESEDVTEDPGVSLDDVPRNCS